MRTHYIAVLRGARPEAERSSMRNWLMDPSGDDSYFWTKEKAVRAAGAHLRRHPNDAPVGVYGVSGSGYGMKFRLLRTLGAKNSARGSKSVTLRNMASVTITRKPNGQVEVQGRKLGAVKRAAPKRRK